MATITFTVPDEVAPLLLNRFANGGGYSGPNTVPAKTAFLKDKTSQFWRSVCKQAVAVESVQNAATDAASEIADIEALSIT